jgi:hypothetical protein
MRFVLRDVRGPDEVGHACAGGVLQGVRRDQTFRMFNAHIPTENEAVQCSKVGAIAAGERVAVTTAFDACAIGVSGTARGEVVSKCFSGERHSGIAQHYFSCNGGYPFFAGVIQAVSL